MSEDMTYVTGGSEPALVLVPVQAHEAEILIKKLNSSGYEAVQFKDMESVMAALNMEPLDIDAPDFELLDACQKELGRMAEGKGKVTDTSKLVQVLANIGLILADIARTHKRAMPPLLE